ncbi:thioredoxin domain-containing protein [Erythrobacter sp. JK5]|uniref:thioredoxin domain-containing protein n=1 Tax=Erythrobacter sp. JK5 TaxID=2829500 RepID=UPI001BAB773A|nr:thioredoxin domain-containing protein [Erythrobacter sp. JK5]QUL38296.1 thioredoxin domain-containing protein [Erythrobacter sp. JK5]
MTVTRATPFRRLAIVALAAPLSLALAGCNGSDDPEGAPSGEAIAAIPAPAGTTWLDTVTVTPEMGYLVGNPEAPIKLVEYASHTCNACAFFATNAKTPLKENYISTGVVAFEQRELIRNSFDLVMATLVQCGPKESMQPLSDQAWQSFSDIMNGIQANPEAVNASGELPPEQRFVRVAEVTGLIDFFAARGLSADQARSCLADTAKIEAIAKASDEQAKEFNVTGTPTFFLNGSRVEGISWEDIEPALQRAGARKE